MLQMAWNQGWPLDKIVTDVYPVENAQEAMESAIRLNGLKTVIGSE